MPLEPENIDDGDENQAAGLQGKIGIENQLPDRTGAVDLIAVHCGRDENRGTRFWTAADMHRNLNRMTTVAGTNLEEDVSSFPKSDVDVSPLFGVLQPVPLSLTADALTPSGPVPCLTPGKLYSARTPEFTFLQLNVAAFCGGCPDL